MTKDDIIYMARQAGFEIDCCSLEWHDRIERFATLVAAAEREACAKVCEEDGLLWGQRYATVIRAKGQE